MTIITRGLRCASFAVVASAIVAPAHADDKHDDITVTGQRARAIAASPATTASTDADTIARTVNAINVEDALKYLPSLIVRKRHIGDTQAPLATRTSGLGASARSLIYADGALLSALIGNNNTSASPKWSIVSPQEIARIDILYGPFSAAYPGNSIGAVVNIITRMAATFEGTITAGASVQPYHQYGSRAVLPAYQIGMTVGDRFGPLAVFASYDHVRSKSQPLGFATATAAPAGTIGAYPDVNRLNQPIVVLGATGSEDQGQDRIKLKAALDITRSIRLSYTGALFLNDTRAMSDTYLTTVAGGQPNYPLALSSGVYRTRQRHWSHAVSLDGTSPAIDWQVIGTRYVADRDEQRIPATALPAALGGGAGTITRLNGTGWTTLDAKAAWRMTARNTISAGAHWDRFVLASNRYTTADWIAGDAEPLNLQSAGRTQTTALWAQDAWTIAPPLTLTIGGRYEWWRAFDGVNFSTSPPLAAIQPIRSSARFSPKATLGWTVARGWTVRASFGEAWRFPTVGELYQIVTTPVPAVPDPTLRPEHARSEELAVEHADTRGFVRLALFNEIVRDALVSQTGPLPVVPVQVGSFVQNVGRTRARGAEVAVVRNDVLPRIDVSGSVTYADATTRADAAFPAAAGKTIPGVPRWKATAVATWRPVNGVALTAAGRYASRIYGALDNSDVVGNTYQGFYRYLVVDLRAQFAVGKVYMLGLGVDNLTNDRYFLFHPFPQRTFHADVTARF